MPGVEVMAFGAALDALKAGKRVARIGWDNMHLFAVKDWVYAAHSSLPGTNTAPFIAMKTADDKVVPWLNSHTDAFALDWTIVP